MKKNGKKFLIPIIMLIVYFLMLILTVAVEKNAEGSSIHSFGDALWYSMATMTSVGYGDTYPVTQIGRWVGFIFMLISVGVLALVFSFIVSLMVGELFPRIRLRRLRNKDWYLFTSASREALMLAKSITGENKNAYCLFTGGEEPGGENDRISGIGMTVHKLCGYGRRVRGIFIVGGDSFENFKSAQEYAQLQVPVYCDTDIETRNPVDGLRTFNKQSNCGRMYWQKNLPAPGTDRIIMIGCGSYAWSILEQALLVNVFGKDRHLTYHIFGEKGYCEAESFKNNHTELEKFVSVDGEAEGKDAVYFHQKSWNADSSLLTGADRIILCTDSDEENIAILSSLLKYYPVTCPVHVRTLYDLKGYGGTAKGFGMAGELYTGELVMLEKLNDLAVKMNNIYREEYPDFPEWKELDWFRKKSNIAAADHLFVKIAILTGKYDEASCAVTGENCEKAFAVYQERRLRDAEDFRYTEHERWMRFHYMYNWQQDRNRSNEHRLHPMLIDYAALSKEEQEKDDYAWELIGKMGQ